MPESHVNHNACLWQPQEDEIALTSVPDPSSEVFPFESYWHLQLSRDLAIGLGRHPDSPASDAAAMRKLSAVAAEVAAELERRAGELNYSSDEGGERA